MKTSVEMILKDILLFIRRIIRTFFCVFRKGYSLIIEDQRKASPALISPTLFFVLATTIYYCLTLGKRSKFSRNMEGEVYSYFEALQKFSLIEAILCTLPFITIFYFARKFFMSLVNEKDDFATIYTYSVSSYLLVLLIFRLLLIWGWTKSVGFVFVIYDFRLIIFAIVVFFATLVKSRAFKKRRTGMESYKIYLPTSVAVTVFVLGYFTTKQLQFLEKNYPVSEIEIASDQFSCEELDFIISGNPDTTGYTLSTSIFVSNHSDHNLVFYGNSDVFEFNPYRSNKNIPVFDSLSAMYFVCTIPGSPEDDYVYVNSGDSRVLHFNGYVSDSLGDWLIANKQQFENLTYMRMHFHTTNKYSGLPYFLRTVNLNIDSIQ